MDNKREILPPKSYNQIDNPASLSGSCSSSTTRNTREYSPICTDNSQSRSQNKYKQSAASQSQDSSLIANQLTSNNSQSTALRTSPNSIIKIIDIQKHPKRKQQHSAHSNQNYDEQSYEQQLTSLISQLNSEQNNVDDDPLSNLNSLLETTTITTTTRTQLVRPAMVGGTEKQDIEVLLSR